MHENFKELLEDGGRQNLQKIFTPLHLLKIYQMRPLLAWSILLDSTFKNSELCITRKKPFVIIKNKVNDGLGV
jgi:hypothetical protein